MMENQVQLRCSSKTKVSLAAVGISLIRHVLGRKKLPSFANENL